MNGTALYQFTPPSEDEGRAVSGTASMGRVVPPGIDTSHGTILYLEDIEVSFDGFRALKKLSLAIDAGELRCVIGPNGAGKTTMMDVITGKTRPDAGKVFLGQTIDLARMNGFRDRARGHRPQVPEADRVRTASGVGEPRTRDADRQGLARVAARKARSPRAGEDRGDARADRPREPFARPASCRTGRSSGSRSACC